MKLMEITEKEFFRQQAVKVNPHHEAFAEAGFRVVSVGGAVGAVSYRTKLSTEEAVKALTDILNGFKHEEQKLPLGKAHVWLKGKDAIVMFFGGKKTDIIHWDREAGKAWLK